MKSQLKRYCCEAKYRLHDTVIKDISETLSIYKSLDPELDNYVYENGREEKLIALRGTIPINYRGVTYHIPICVYVRKDYPESPPICYVRPTSDMTIKESKNVDSQGKITVLYLDNWTRNSQLSSLIQVMIITFSEKPPVYKKINPTTVSTTSVKPTYPTSSYPSAQYPFNSYYGPSYYPSPYNTNTSTTPTSNFTNTISDSDIRASLLSAASDKIRDSLKDKLEQYSAETDVLKKTELDLITGSKQLDQIIAKMESDIGLLEDTKAKLEENDKKMSDLILTYENSEKNFCIDDVYGPNQPIYKQLLNTFAEENSIADAIFHLNDALKKEVIDLEVFLKHVRELSRRQFMLRALMQKCRDKAGLSY